MQLYDLQICLLLIKIQMLQYLVLNSKSWLKMIKKDNTTQFTDQHIPLSKILNFNSNYEYLKIISKNKRQLIKGNRGHNSCFLKKPVIEGKFYVEMVGHYPEQTINHYKNPPSFRVGVAPTQYYYNYPLGQDFSVAYKMDGQIIQQGKCVARVQPYSFGDTIGVGLSIAQVYKNRDKNKRVKSNYVQFYKNGKAISQSLYLLTQDLYTFSASLYNQSQIQINLEPHTIKHLPYGYKPYSIHLFQKSLYLDFEISWIQNQILNELNKKMEAIKGM